MRSRVFPIASYGVPGLESADDEELRSAKMMMTWGNKEKILKPTHIIMRALTHIFSHQGQIMAMCRLLGKPVQPGLDFPMHGG